MAQNRRRHSSYERKNVSMKSYYAAAASLVSILYFVAMIIFSILTMGNVMNITAGLSVVAFIIAVISLIIGQKEFQNKGNSTASRLVGLILPIIATVCWVYVYGIGLLTV